MLIHTVIGTFPTMLSVVSLWFFLSVMLGQPEVTLQRDSLWVFKEPGDIVLNGLFPIRTRSKKGFELNYEAITWMGAMINRIREINEKKMLPGNLSLGFAIHDTTSDVKIGLRQTLQVLNEIVNKNGKENGGLRIPVVIGPAADELESNSESLYSTFDVPRIVYTVTSSRFSYNNFGKFVRAVPSDFIHIEALLRLLNDTKAENVTVIVSKSRLWQERMKQFRAALDKWESGIKVNNVIHVSTMDMNDITFVHQRITDEIVIILTEANISRSLIHIGQGSKTPPDQTWIQVCRFDDPLLRVFDTYGKLTKQVIARNLRSSDVDNYRSNLRKTLSSNGADKAVMKPNWLKAVFEKYCVQSKISPSHNESVLSKECSGFRNGIISAIGHDNEASSLTLQGVINAVNLIIASLESTLKNCTATANPRHCAKLSGSVLLAKLRQLTQSKEKDPDKVYSLQLLRRDSTMLGRRMTVRGWTFKKFREWLITQSELQYKQSLCWNNSKYPNNAISYGGDNNQINGHMNSSSFNDTCKHCVKSLNQSHCVSDAVAIAWTSNWTIVLYALEILCFLAVVSSFVYFSQHKNSPIMILCYSWPDDIVLGTLCIFSLLPMMHIGQMAPQRCTAIWPIVNIVFAFYTALLLTKTLFVQNLLKCEVATERPGRRMTFALVITLVQVLILPSLFIFDFMVPTHLTCTPHGIIKLCNIEDNMAIIASMIFNWLLMCALFALSLTETLKQRQNFCRTENLVAVATVAWTSYTCLVALAYFNIRIGHYLAVVLIKCLIYLVNLMVCLGLVYVPTLRLVSTWLRQHTRQKKNLTSIKRAQVMSSKRQSSGPIRDSLFGGNFSTDQLAIPTGRQSGYYFDLRPSSAATDMSYPTSLVRSVHEQTHVVFGYGRRGAMSLNGGTSVESVPSVDWLEAPSEAQSASSSYDNLSRAAEETADELTPQELLHEISTYWERHRSSDVIANGQNEDNIETNKWPSLEKLRTSDL